MKTAMSFLLSVAMFASLLVIVSGDSIAAQSTGSECQVTLAGGSANLVWDAVDGISNYQVRSTNTAGDFVWRGTVTDGTTFTDSDAQSGEEYIVRYRLGGVQDITCTTGASDDSSSSGSDDSSSGGSDDSSSIGSDDSSSGSDDSSSDPPPPPPPLPAPNDEGVVVLDTIPFPENPTPFDFFADTGGFEGVELSVSSSGGLYPWDVRVQPAFTTPTMQALLVSELVDLQLNPISEDSFDGASLTLEYDPALLTVPESELQIWTYDPDLQFWIPGGVSQTIDTDANTITAELDHFSIYAILDIAASDPRTGWTRVFGDVPAECVATDNNVGVDVIFTIDTSGSMATNDPTGLRVDAANVFLDAMQQRDSAGVVSFSSSALVRGALRQLETPEDRQAIEVALEGARAAAGGTNISSALSVTTSQLQNSPAGRPRIAILLTDGTGTYSRSFAEAAAAENITVFAVGLGAGANQTILGEIADVTGGEFIQLSTADQLVPLYAQLGDQIFDDGTDSDGDSISDCVEINGAFTPAAAARAWPFSGFVFNQTTPNGALVQTRPDLADTDGDTVADGVELREADLRGNEVLVEVYSYLIEAGVTRYYIEDSDPLDPLDPSANVLFRGEPPFGFSGLFDIEGLDIDQSTLFQPSRYVDRPVIDSRLVIETVASGFRIGQIDYTDSVVYDDGHNCTLNCAEVQDLAQRRADQVGFLAGILGCDNADCKGRDIVRDARFDQRVFEDPVLGSALRDYFVDEQVTLQCALQTRDIDRCAVNTDPINFSGILPDEIGPLVSLLNERSTRVIDTPGLQVSIGEPRLNTVLIESGDVESYLEYRDALGVLHANFDRIDSGTGAADGVVTRNQLFNVAPGIGLSAEAVNALATLEAIPDRLDQQFLFVDGSTLTIAQVRDSMVRNEIFALNPGTALDVLRDFPLVDKGEEGIATNRFNILDSPLTDYEPALLLLVDTALVEADPNDRVLQNEIISRVPETRTGIRNALITALYSEYGRAIQNWLGPVAVKGGNWALTAPWASLGVGAAIRGEILGGFASGAHQCVPPTETNGSSTTSAVGTQPSSN